MTRTLLALPVVLVLLSGCGSDPAAAVRADVAALTEAANDGDAAAVRDRADVLMSTVDAQRQADEISAEEAERLIALAQSVRTGADVIDAELIERRRAEAEAEAAAAAKQLEEARKQLEEERRKAEEAAREAAEQRDDDEKGRGRGKDDEKDDD